MSDIQEAMNEAADAVTEWSSQNTADGGVCDFCCTPLPGHEVVTYLLEAPQLSALEGIEAGSLSVGTIYFANSPDWAACEQCVPVIDEHDPAKLADFVIDNRYKPVADRGLEARREDGEMPADVRRVVHADLVDLYESFYALNPRKVATTTIPAKEGATA